MARACELASRGVGNVSPNPPVGAVIVGASGGILGEGYHHCRGEAHAEREALRDARERGHADALVGATMYVSLEPCNHHGRTPPCTEAVIEARLARVVVGAVDPNPRTALGGVQTLTAEGLEVVVVHDAAAQALLRYFEVSVTQQRPYVTLKLAASLDGRIAAAPGSFWLTGVEARAWVHELRYVHDAVMIGAHTAAIDNPSLTIRPTRARLREFSRVVVCGATPPREHAKIFEPAYATRTILLVPGAYADRYAHLQTLATVISIGSEDEQRVKLDLALQALYELEIAAILCEGGPALAGSLLAEQRVDRLEWIVAPRILTTREAPSILVGDLASHIERFEFSKVEKLGRDLRLSIDFNETK